jgi:hypothetical protein
VYLPAQSKKKVKSGTSAGELYVPTLVLKPIVRIPANIFLEEESAVLTLRSKDL